eukprot:1158369-Pelagomonas_calceolata.AAC.12
MSFILACFSSLKDRLRADGPAGALECGLASSSDNRADTLLITLLHCACPFHKSRDQLAILSLKKRVTQGGVQVAAASMHCHMPFVTLWAEPTTSDSSLRKHKEAAHLELRYCVAGDVQALIAHALCNHTYCLAQPITI